MYSLPGWMIATTGSEAAASHNPAMQAMCQIIYLAEDAWEGNKRFQNMVQAAIEQFNTGSLARAATMFDLAIGICSDDKLDPATVATFRKTAHESLDMKRLRSLAKESSKHHLLRKVLGFFDVFTVPNILDSLQKEEKRDRRRLLLDLLEAYGDAARPLVLERLKQLLADTNVATDWYYARNLVYILNAIPPANNASLKEEVELIAPLLRLSLPMPLIKEAIRYAGQTRSSESEDLLISTADKLEKVVFEYASSGRDATQRLSLLDRAIYALAHYGTPKSSERVVKHGVCGQAALGDTTSRLTYLSGQDLTSDQESLSILIQFLKSRTPRKLLGMRIQKNEQVLSHAIKALSSTPAPIVRETFEKIARQFPETKFGQAAAGALKGFDSFEQPGIQTEHLLTGDLDLFGLPDLLQQLHQLHVTGELTLKDAKGVPVGIFSLIAGRMQNCSAGHLAGMEAAYQLLEKPAAGTFVFQGQKKSGAMEPSEEHETEDLSTVLSEGMRRYDALLRARALVPDFALLKRRGTEPVPPTDKEDAKISDFIWKKTAAGTSPEECEAVCQADSSRIRTLLARWVEEGVLTVE